MTTPTRGPRHHCEACDRPKPDQSQRPDVPNVGLFNHWEDALAQADRHAALTGYRYRVTFEPHNHWWQINSRGRLDWWHTKRNEALA